MKFFFPPKNQKFLWLQTNRSDDLGSLWSTFNMDFQSNLGMIRLAQKLVTNTTSSDDADLGRPTAFEFWFDEWWAICGTRIFHNGAGNLTTVFAEDTGKYSVGDSTSQFDVTNPAGTTFRYTWDGTGTDPGITALTFPIGSTVQIGGGTNFAAGNRGTFTVTGSGANYFEVTNAAGVVESNKTIGSGTNAFIGVSGGTLGQDYGVNSDLKIYNDRLWATTATALWSRSSLTLPWIKRADLNGGTLHNMVVLPSLNRLYFKDGNTVLNSIDVDDVVSVGGTDANAIDFGTAIGFLTSMVAGSSFIWLGTQRINVAANVGNSGLAGSVLQWDGYSAVALNEYVVPAAGVLSMTILNDVPYGMDSEGRLLRYTGYAFEEIARLPLNRVQLTLASGTQSTDGRFVHFNGMQTTKNGTIFVLINNLNQTAAADVEEELPSGIWECDVSTGNFTHRYSATLKSMSSSTVSDYGQNRVLGVGALKINTLMSNSANGRSTIVAGFAYYTDASTAKYGIFIDSPSRPTTDLEGQKRGYFVTTWFNSEEVQDKWTRLWAVFRRLLDATDKITFKYRLNEEAPTLASITWLSTTQFTTATDVTAYAPGIAPFNSTTGGEVEVLQGTGGGSCTHISAISGPSGGLYTVTLDTAVPNVSGTAKVRFQKWVKMYPTITGQVLSFAQMPIGASNVRIMIKCVLEFTGDDEFAKFALWSNEDIKITA